MHLIFSFWMERSPVILIIDLATRFCVGDVLRAGRSSVQVIRALESLWTSRFGFPARILSDGAGETKSREFVAYCQAHNIQSLVTPAQSQFANGICERHIGIVKSMMPRQQQGRHFEHSPFLAARTGRPLQSIDFKRTFLQARKRSPEEPAIVIHPPREAAVAHGTMWILEKSVYGLRSAPREWWLTRIMAALLDIGFRQSQHDVALFYYVEDGITIGAMVIHVDDVLTTGSSEFEKVLKRVEQRFQTLHTSRHSVF